MSVECFISAFEIYKLTVSIPRNPLAFKKPKPAIMSSHPFKDATIPIKPFRIDHTQQNVDDMKTLIRLSPLGPETYENSAERQEKLGISMDSMKEIKDAWLDYDWMTRQTQLNELPQFIAQVEDTDPKSGKRHTFDIHFVGKMSPEKDAIPLIMLHGWPGMGLFELTPMIQALEEAGAPPLHLIIMRCVPFVDATRDRTESFLSPQSSRISLQLSAPAGRRLFTRRNDPGCAWADDGSWIQGIRRPGRRSRCLRFSNVGLSIRRV